MSARSQALRGLVLPGVLSLIALGVLIGLGNWQMQRLAWKENLIANVSERVKQPPQPLPGPGAWPKLDLEENEYRAFTVSGRFRHENEVQVYTVLSQPKGSFSGAGYWVLTPLELDSGAFVVVNRGFVPQELKNPASRAEGQLSGPVKVTGLLRAPEQVNYFMPANDASKAAWYRREPADIAKAFGLKNVAPFLLDATGEYRPDMLPQPNETRVSFVNNHLGYALTWYGLAATLIGVFSAFAWQRLRSTQNPKSAG
jgi:surfeit locus 1 family protein